MSQLTELNSNKVNLMVWTRAHRSFSVGQRRSTPIRGVQHQKHLVRFTHIFSSAVRELLEVKVLDDITRAPLSLSQFHLLRAVALDPALAVAHYHLGRLWAAQGAVQQAREAFARALDLDTTGELAPLVEIPRCARNDN